MEKLGQQHMFYLFCSESVTSFFCKNKIKKVYIKYNVSYRLRTKKNEKTYYCCCICVGGGGYLGVLLGGCWRVFGGVFSMFLEIIWPITFYIKHIKSIYFIRFIVFLSGVGIFPVFLVRRGYMFSFWRGIRIWGQTMPNFGPRREKIGKRLLLLQGISNQFFVNIMNCCMNIIFSYISRFLVRRR